MSTCDGLSPIARVMAGLDHPCDAHIADLTAERDRARAIAVALEQRLARVESLLRWREQHPSGRGYVIPRSVPRDALVAALEDDQ